MEIKQVKITDILPYEQNPRKNDEAVDVVAESIKRYGFKVPIILDKDGVIVAGHTRIKAATKLGLETVPCIYADDLSDDEVRQFRLVDNKTAEFAQWDFELLELELEEIDIDLSIFGFELELTDLYDNDPDEMPNIGDTEPIIQREDIVTLGNHRLMCGDSTSADDVERLMGGVKADMVFTDPPYNVNYSSKNEFLNNHDKGNRIQKDIEGDTDGNDERVGKGLWAPAFQNMYDNAKDHCSIYVTMPQGGAHMMMMMMMMCAAYWQVKHELIWLKNNHVLGRVDYLYKHEPILFGWKKTHKFYGKGNHQKSVWEIDKPLKSDLHPTMKPVELVENALLNSSENGDIILDLFLGSGTTIIASEKTNRTCYGMELDPHYCDVIINRYIDFTGNNDVTVERNGKTYKWGELETQRPLGVVRIYGKAFN